MELLPIAKTSARILGIAAVLYLLLVLLLFFLQRSLIYFPSHSTPKSVLAPWVIHNLTLGYCREVPNPHTIWLMLHGNAGQAADRDYVLPSIAPTDSLYVLEYPGYGSRAGRPSRESIDRAAAEAYQFLRQQHPGVPVCALAESIGSGPACALANQQPPPEKIVLIVPFDTLVSVASERFSFLPVRWLLRDRWDNIESLKGYGGPVDVFAATDDEIIPVEHSRRLVQHVPTARLVEFRGGHNGWGDSGVVLVRR